MRNNLMIAAVFAAGALAAQTVVPVRWMLQTDGQRVYPAGILATETEVGEVKAQSNALKEATDANTVAASNLTARLEALRDSVADATVDGAWALSLFCPAVGFAAKTSDGTSRIEWTKVATPDSPTAAFMANREIDLDRLTLQVGAPLSEFIARPKRDTSATVTPDGTGAFPDGEPAWRYTVAFAEVPGAAEGAGFYKLVYDDELIIGQGNFFPIVGGLSVNGAEGRTVTVQATDDAGETVTLTFKGGLLVEELATEAEP